VTIPLLTTKLIAPRTALSTLVHRDRIVQRLNAAQQAKCILFSAPAGFGKTTVVFDWVTSTDLPAAWLTLDEKDNQPVRFWRYVIAALQQAHMLGESPTAWMLENVPPPPLIEILGILVNELAQQDFSQSPGAVLVLNDYHVINHPEIHESLNFFLDYLPPPFQLVLTTRSDPPINLSRLRGRGELCEVRAGDLRFSLSEATLFLNATLHLGLTTAEIETLVQRTEGWIAGLQLAAISLGDVPDPKQFIRDFAGDDRYVADYLVGEVLLSRSQEIQTFLLTTSILDRLTADLCDVITGRGDARQILQRLEADNLFIMPLDNRREWYRYHRLFADLLHERLLEQESQETIRGLFLTASRWFESKGYFEDAVRSAIKAGDQRRCVDLLETYGSKYFETSQLLTFNELVEQISADERGSHPKLLIMYAWSLLATGQVNTVEPCLQAVEKQLGVAANQIPVLGSPSAEQMDPRVLAALIEVAAIRTNLEINTFNLAKILEWGDILLPHLVDRGQPYLYNPPHLLRPPVLFMLGLARKYMGHTLQSIPFLEEAVQGAITTNNRHIVALAMGHLADLQIQQGRLKTAAETCHSGLDLLAVDEAQGIISPYAGIMQIHLGHLAYERNQFGEAQQLFEKGIRQLKVWRHWDALVSGYSGLVKIYWVKGDLPGAQAALDEIRLILQETQGEPLLPAVFGLQAWLDLASENLSAVDQWAQVNHFDKQTPPPYLLENEYITFIRLLLAKKEWAEVVERIDKLSRSLQENGRIYRLIKVLVLKAIALENTGEMQNSAQTLLHALSLAEPETYLRTFLDEGLIVRRILNRLAKSGQGGTIVAQLMAANQEVPKVLKQVREAYTDTGIEPLSERELEVLNLLSQGCSNKEIAVALSISPTTVKSHTRSIYGKLGVSSRSRAVATARASGILHR
jgi:LuxR family transcriptional regulator, maltose regulon positive regulatory protein